MSLFGNNNRNPFGIVGGLIYEHRDSLIYSGIAAVSACNFISGEHLYHYAGWAAGAREFIRAYAWSKKNSEPKYCLAGNHTQPNYDKFVSAALTGASVIVLPTMAFSYVDKGGVMPAMGLFALIGATGYAIHKKFPCPALPNGMKDVWDAYKKMWNYTGDNDDKGGHTKRLFNAIKDGFTNAADWMTGRDLPQQQPQPVTVPIPPSRQLASADPA